MEKCRFEMYGICFEHPKEWKIVPEHAMDYTYDRGFVRFEENNRKSQISLGIRWEHADTDNEKFLKAFSEKLKLECQKKLKSKKDAFQIVSESLIENRDGQKMCCLVTQYRATQGLIKNSSRMKTLRIINTACYCEDSRRMIICSLISTPSLIKENGEAFMEILKSVRSGK